MTEIRRELIKNRRATALFLLPVGVVVAFAYWIPIGAEHAVAKEGAGAGPLVSVVALEFTPMYVASALAAVAPLLGLALGVWAATSEHRARTEDHSAVLAGSWFRLGLVKFAGALGGAALLLLGAQALGVVGALVGIGLRPSTLDVVAPAPGVAGSLVASGVTLLGLALWVALGFVIGSVVRSLFTGAVVAVAWVIGEAFWTAPWLPGTAQAASLAGVLHYVSSAATAVQPSFDVGMGPAEGLRATFAWTLALLVAAALLWARRARTR